MIDWQDMRVPVVAGDATLAGPGDVVQPALPEGATRHSIGCTCCQPRPPLAAALARLFLARARGETGYFTRVIVPCPPEREAALAAALTADPVTAARFRFAGRIQPASVSSTAPSASCM